MQLIHPNFEIYFTYEGPIGLAYLKAVIQKAGHNVSVLDNNIFNLPLQQVIEKTKGAEIVAVSMTTPTYKSVRRICTGIRKSLGIPVVVGGAHPTIDPLGCLDFADFVVMGEGEQTFIELLAALESGKDKEKLQKVKGLAFRWNREKIMNERRALNENLDELPFPDWNGFPITKYGSAIRTSGRSLPIVTSRGCPFNCCYCFKGLFGRQFRPRSPKSVVDELQYLKDNFNIREFQIADDAFATDRQRAIGICKEMIKRGINIPWSLPNGIKVNLLNDELVYWMKKSGLKYAGLGVESGNQKILDKIGKQQTLDDVRKGAALLKKYKIPTVGFFMFGLPHDTVESMRDTVRFAKSLKLDYYSITMTTPYPGTRLFEEIKSGKGKFLTKTREELFSLGSKCKFIMPGMASPKEIEDAYKNARLELLLRPKTIIRSFKSPKKLIAGAKVAYKWILKT